MALRWRNFTAFGPEEALHGLIHNLIGWQRVVFGFSTERYFLALIEKGHPISGARLSPAAPLCQICGYQLASIVSDDGWTIEACSVIMARKMVGNERFDFWRAQLPPVESHVPVLARSGNGDSGSVSQASSSNHLQTSSH